MHARGVRIEPIWLITFVHVGQWPYIVTIKVEIKK